MTPLKELIFEKIGQVLVIAESFEMGNGMEVKPLTKKQLDIFNIIEAGHLILWANEDKMVSWYLTNQGEKVRIPYGTYLALWFNRLLIETSCDIDTCIFGYYLIHQ